MSEDTYTGQDDDPLSLNLYVYCHNEPIQYSDPSGHTSYKIINKNAALQGKWEVLDVPNNDAGSKKLQLWTSNGGTN